MSALLPRLAEMLEEALEGSTPFSPAFALQPERVECNKCAIFVARAYHTRLPHHKHRPKYKQVETGRIFEIGCGRRCVVLRVKGDETTNFRNNL